MSEPLATRIQRTVARVPGWQFIAGGVLGVLALIELTIRGAGEGTALLISVALALATTVPVSMVGRSLVASATLMAAAFVSLLTEQRLTIAGLVALVVAFYCLGRYRSVRLVAALLVPFAVLAAGELFSGSGPSTSDRSVSTSIRDDPDPPSDPPEREEPPDSTNPYPAFVALLTIAGAGLGLLQRTRATESLMESKEASFADEALAHTARGERARIARELHDVVAHRISSIAVQAETARLTTTGLPPDGAKQLVAIGDSARDALTDMRRLLGVLRKDADAEADIVTREPQPGVAQISQLVSEAREITGVTVRLSMGGQVAQLDPGVELAAYRIVQESLTNARRHAPGCAIDVELSYSDDALRVIVRDTGQGAAVHQVVPGHGLLGMRERVEAVGGSLSVGATSTGFVVDARLPRSPAATGASEAEGV